MRLDDKWKRRKEEEKSEHHRNRSRSRLRLGDATAILNINLERDSVILIAECSSDQMRFIVIQPRIVDETSCSELMLHSILD